MIMIKVKNKNEKQIKMWNSEKKTTNNTIWRVGKDIFFFVKDFEMFIKK